MWVDRQPRRTEKTVMGQSTELCVRCGEAPADRVYKGAPTCENCEKLLEASLMAKHERSRECPVDSVEMTKEIVLSIVVDRCPVCHGVWLDGGELELLKNAIKAGMSDEFARALLLPW